MPTVRTPESAVPPRTPQEGTILPLLSPAEVILLSPTNVLFSLTIILNSIADSLTGLLNIAGLTFPYFVLNLFFFFFF